MLIFLTGGTLAFLTGILLILFPKVLKKIGEYMSMSVLNVDSFVYKIRLGIGISLILSGACLLFLAYYEYAIKILQFINR